MNLLSKTILDCFAERVRYSPDKIAIEYGDQLYTWEELNQVSDYLAVRMGLYGMEKGDHVGLWSVNTPNWLITFLAVIKIGAIPVLINTGYQESELRNIIHYADIKYIFYGDGYGSLMYNSMIKNMRVEQDRQIKGWIPIGRDIEGKWMSEKSFTSLEKAKHMVAGIREIEKQISPSDTAVMLFTSGTTSISKGVLLSHFSLVNNSIETARHMGWTSKDKMLIVVPLFHCFGITSGLLASIYVGCTMHLMDYFKTRMVLEHIQQYACTILNGVPSMFLAMLRNPQFDEFDLSSLQSGIIAGSFISPEEYTSICNKIKTINLHPSYGQTETSPCVSISDCEDPFDKRANSTGRIIDEVKVRIVDCSTNQPMGLGQIGEIQVKGYNVMQSYYKLLEETRKTILEDGWLKTGDLGYQDAEGYLYITGRIKEMIIRGGENISPQEIEIRIKEYPNIRNVKVVGIPTEVLQEMIVACVIMEPGVTFNEKDIQAYLSSKLAHYKIPSHILSFHTFPINSSGKIRTPELKQLVIERLLHEQK